MKNLVILIILVLLTGCLETELEIDILWEDEYGNYLPCDGVGVEGMQYVLWSGDGYIEAQSKGIISCQNMIIKDVWPDDMYTIEIAGYYEGFDIGTEHHDLC